MRLEIGNTVIVQYERSPHWPKKKFKTIFTPINQCDMIKFLVFASVNINFLHG